MTKTLRSIMLAAAVLSSTAVAVASAYAQESQEKSGEEKPKGDGG